jgi:hypothetical protein
MGNCLSLEEVALDPPIHTIQACIQGTATTTSQLLLRSTSLGSSLSLGRASLRSTPVQLPPCLGRLRIINCIQANHIPTAMFRNNPGFLGMSLQNQPSSTSFTLGWIPNMARKANPERKSSCISHKLWFISLIAVMALSHARGFLIRRGLLI